MPTAFLGSLLLVPYTEAPDGWSTCQGQLLPVAQNTALWSLFSNTFGGDGQTTFALPNLTTAGQVKDANGHPLHWIICLQGLYPAAAGELTDILPGTLTLIPGEVIARDRVPTGWLPCKGQTLPIRGNEALCWGVRNTYGGDGETTFALPDLTGVPPAAPANGPGFGWIIRSEGEIPGRWPHRTDPWNAFMGSLTLVAADYDPPEGWLPCEGQVLPISDYYHPHRLVGNTYGGDGQTTFALPNLAGPAATKDANGHPLKWVMCMDGEWPYPLQGVVPQSQ